MALPFLRVAFHAAHLLKKYGGVLPHINKPRATAGFLGRSLKNLRTVWEDEEYGTLFTLYDSIEKVLEIKVFMHLTANNLNIPTRGKAPTEILQAIVQKLEEEGAIGAVREIKDTMQWAAELFQRPEVQEIFKEASVPLKKPDLTKPVECIEFGKNIIERMRQEASRVHGVMNVAKKKNPPSSGGPKP